MPGPRESEAQDWVNKSNSVGVNRYFGRDAKRAMVRDAGEMDRAYDSDRGGWRDAGASHNREVERHVREQRTLHNHDPRNGR